MLNLVSKRGFVDGENTWLKDLFVFLSGLHDSGGDVTVAASIFFIQSVVYS